MTVFKTMSLEDGPDMDEAVAILVYSNRACMPFHGMQHVLPQRDATDSLRKITNTCTQNKHTRARTHRHGLMMPAVANSHSFEIHKHTFS